MYRASEFTKPVYRIGEVAEWLGVTTNTVRTYDREGKIKTVRSDGGHRLIPRESLIEFLKQKDLLLDDSVPNRRDVIYARVSSYDQKNDLDRQALYIVEHCDNLQNPLILKEIGSGLNDRRKQLQKLLEMVMADEVRTVYVTYKDRLTRFGFNYLETVFGLKGVNIVVLNNPMGEKNVEKELVDDMMSLIASFSGKLYGLRSGKNRKAGV